MKEQPNPFILQAAFSKNGYPYQKNVDVSDMCSNISYILVLPLTWKEALDEKNFNTVPYVITYEDQSLKIYELMAKYRSMNENLKNQYTFFTFKDGKKLCQDSTVRQLVKQLGRRDLNNLVLYTGTDPILIYKTYEQLLSAVAADGEIYSNQSSVTQFLDKVEEFGNKKDLQLTIQIPLEKKKVPEMITLNVLATINGKDLKEIILNQIKLDFGVNLIEEDMESLVIKETCELVCQQKEVLSQHIFNKSTLVQNFKDKQLILSRKFKKNYKSELIVYNLGQKNPKKFDYKEISQCTVEKLYNTYLELEESKMRKDLSYGLKIQDIIIRPEQKISKAKVYFERESHQTVSVVGKIIDEKMVFHYTIPKLLNASQQFKIDQYIKIPTHQQEKRKQYRQILRDRANKTLNQYFRKEERLQPILIYTAELFYFQNQKQCKTATIYQSLNRFLRDTPILSLDLDVMKKQWRYLYSNALLTHLKKIPPYFGRAYRGISYNPNAYDNKIITFKQFLSTSTKREVGLNFAKKSKDKIKRMFEFNLIQGYPITQFSIYTGEQEVLLEPFSDFKVIQTKKCKEKIKQKKNAGSKEEEIVQVEYDFQVYVLQQLPTSKTLPDVRANFIVWIDDKPKQGQIIFSRIDMPQQITVFVQLLSTEALQKWLTDYNFLFSDKTANLIFISNMTRMEGKKLNEIAGIQGLKVIRKFKPDAEVFFYVGDLEKLKQKLSKNNVDGKNVLVGIKSPQVFKHITDRIKIGK